MDRGGGEDIETDENLGITDEDWYDMGSTKKAPGNVTTPGYISIRKLLEPMRIADFYASKMVELGYDDPADLYKMDDMELREVAMTVGMKPGHQSRFVKTVSEMSQGGMGDMRGRAASGAGEPRARFSFSGFRSRSSSNAGAPPGAADGPRGSFSGLRSPRGSMSGVPPGIATAEARPGEEEDYLGGSSSAL